MSRTDHARPRRLAAETEAKERLLANLRAIRTKVASFDEYVTVETLLPALDKAIEEAQR